MKNILFTLLLIGCSEPTIVIKMIHKPQLYIRPACTIRPIVVAVIDTGFGYQDIGIEARLCNYGHKDFTNKNEYITDFNTKDPIPKDNHGHGTNIVGIIDDYAKQSGTNYCIVILKYYDASILHNNNLENTIKAINYATQIKADFINYSGGGYDKSPEEALAVKKFIDKGGKFIAAAGNEKINLDQKDIGYYPAMEDDRVISVGNAKEINENAIIPSGSSNYGNRVKRWEIGESISAFGLTMTGTSQATAVATGKIISTIKRKCN